MNLDQLRKKINKIDSDILKAFQKRRDISVLVGKYKIKNKLPIYQPERERVVIKNLSKLATDMKLDPKFISKIFKTVFKYSRSIQSDLKKRL